MIPVYSVIAYSNTGKTTYLERLIPALKRRGLRVCVYKHDAHDFAIDKEGKDSWRMTRAGADVTMISSATHAAVMENRPVEPEEMIRRVKDVDVILTEGFKHRDWKKILLYRKGSAKEMAADPDTCFAVTADVLIETKAPFYRLEDTEGMAALIAEDCLAEKMSCPQK